MRKPTNEKIERNALRLLAVVSLACTLTAFGCTMNRMRGNGQSTEQTPEIGPANSSSAPGSSSGTMNPPMASGAIVVDPTRPLAVDAQATLAADQAYQGRVLGGVNPPATTQVSSSVSSAVTAPATMGADVAVATTPLTTVPMSGNATDVSGTPAAATNSTISTMSNATLATPTNSAIATPALATAPAATSTTARPTTTSTTVKTAKVTTTSKTSKKTSAKVTTKATAAATTQPVHIETSSTGDVVVTNTTTNPPQQR